MTANNTQPATQKKTIAVIGSGISGLTSAYLLNKAGHEVHLFEKDTRLGGHTHTTKVCVDGKNHRVDSGFIVFNDWTYPNFIKLIHELGVQSQPSNMSFSVYERNSESSDGGFFYAGTSLASMFSQPKHIVSAKFWRMLFDIVRFNKRAITDFEADSISKNLSLSEYLAQANYGDWFINRYILPMGGAIWSSSNSDIEKFPAYFFVRFFHHHGLLNIKNRPQWHVIKNGSASYVEAMHGKLGTVHLASAIDAIERTQTQVTLTSNGTSYSFDEVVFACHSDQALAILGDQATKQEQEVLGAIPYRPNDVTAHTDESFLPHKDIARSSWNVALSDKLNELPVLTYYMNMLQGLESKKSIAVSVNCKDEIEPRTVLYQEHYSHPTFTAAGIQAQNQHAQISGHNRTHYAGAYWFNGFHEDGVKSGVRVCTQLGVHW